MDTYVSCRQKTVAQFIATRPIIDLSLEAAWRPGSTGGQAVVGSGWLGLGGNTNGGSGGGTDGGGGGDGRGGDGDRLKCWGG